MCVLHVVIYLFELLYKVTDSKKRSILPVVVMFLHLRDLGNFPTYLNRHEKGERKRMKKIIYEAL